MVLVCVTAFLGCSSSGANTTGSGSSAGSRSEADLTSTETDSGVNEAEWRGGLDELTSSMLEAKLGVRDKLDPESLNILLMEGVDDDYQFIEYLRRLKGCSVALAELGEPTELLRPAQKKAANGCSLLEAGASHAHQGINAVLDSLNPDWDLIERGKRELSQGAKQFRAANAAASRTGPSTPPETAPSAIGTVVNRLKEAGYDAVETDLLSPSQTRAGEVAEATLTLGKGDMEISVYRSVIEATRELNHWLPNSEGLEARRVGTRVYVGFSISPDGFDRIVAAAEGR
jgi:hypothetical protein